MRSFVFVSNIPAFLLEPLPDGARVARNRDPRFERLRCLLASHTSGVMMVMHLETRGFGLALYATEREALDACKARIVPEQPGHAHPPLRLRILERERPAPPEAVYKPTLLVEGVEIEKSALAMTRGLELVYSGHAVARWCPHTAAAEDCPFGTACYRLHRREVQRTVQKRPRLERLLQPDHNHNQQQQQQQQGDNGGQRDEAMTPEESEALRAALQSTRRVEELLVPAELRVSGSVHIPITRDEAQSLVDGASPTCLAELAARISAAVPTEMRDGPLFVKFGIPGGAPWDWSLHDAAVGIPSLRRRSPFPASGTETPLARDLYAQRLLFHVNAMNRFAAPADALRAFASSPKARAALERHFAGGSTSHAAGTNSTITHTHTHTHTTTSTSTTASTNNTMSTVELCVRPWLALPTAGAEVRVLIEQSGGRLRAVAQRHAALRLMTSAQLIARNDGSEWARFAIIGSGGDAEAEALLEAELREARGVLRRAVEALRAHLRQRVVRGELPRGGMFCLQLARIGERAVVLSAKPYTEGLEECVALGADKGAELWWNLEKHMYVPLFARELMERLRDESA